MEQLVEQLSAPEWYDRKNRKRGEEKALPSVETLRESVEMLRAIFFPGYFGPSDMPADARYYYTGVTLDRLTTMLTEQVRRGLCFDCERERDGSLQCGECEKQSRNIVEVFRSRLPRIKELLATDVLAAYEGDPAAKSPSEAIFCYPSLRALTNYRIAHELHLLGTKLIPRIITETAHSETGIDIHPGADIGESFFMDHGTGIVIGETCIIERNVRIYQGVTLGAKSFPLDENGNPIKGIPRHPIVEEDVIIYAEATILGRVRIGRGSVIGGNVWVTHDVPPYSKIQQGKSQAVKFEDGGGI